MRLGRLLLGSLTTGALLLAAGPADASSADLPFTATFSGTAAMPAQGMAVFDGSGRATHMGALKADGHAFITGPDDSCPNGLANTHVETLTAANGDELTITSLDVACPVGVGVFDGTGDWTVTGGTGRFADATGEGSFVGTVDFVHGAFTITLTGSIVLGG